LVSAHEYGSGSADGMYVVNLGRDRVRRAEQALAASTERRVPCVVRSWRGCEAVLEFDGSIDVGPAVLVLPGGPS
jgi:hypothetical protein